MKKFIYLSFILCFVSIAQSFANTAPLPLESYGSLPKVSMMVISPSGEKIAYRAVQGDKDMVVAYDIKNKKHIVAANISEIRPNHFYFVDEQHLILVAETNTRIGGFKGRHNVSTAYSYNLNTKKIVPLLVPGKGIYKGQSAVGRIVGISEDGRYAYMPAWKTQGKKGLMRANLDSKRSPKTHVRSPSDVIDYFLDGDEVIARERFNNKKNLHSIEVFQDDEWTQIFKQETQYRTRSFVGLTADLQNLVMLAEGQNGRWGYYTMALADGKIAGPIYNPDDKDVESVLTDINRIVYGVRYSGFRPQYDFFDQTIKNEVDKVLAMVPDDSFTLVDYTPDWNSMIFLLEGSSSSGDYYLYRDGKLSFLSSKYTDIPSEQVLPVISLDYKARDGLKIPTLLTIPAVENIANMPAILLPHGGPESYDRLSFNWLAQYFASRGYLVIQPQFRGSTGFGSDFTLKGRGEWGRKMQDDLSDAVRTLVKSGYVDKDRVCIVGASYGGYAALAGAAFTPNMYQCAVSINGVSDVARMLEDEERDYGGDHWVVEYWQDLIAKGEVDEDHMENISPINHVEKITIPVMLIHGTRDKIVPLHQSDNMYDELEELDKPVEFIKLEKGDHYLSKGHNRLKALEAAAAFISKHI